MAAQCRTGVRKIIAVLKEIVKATLRRRADQTCQVFRNLAGLARVDDGRRTAAIRANGMHRFQHRVLQGQSISADRSAHISPSFASAVKNIPGAYCPRYVCRTFLFWATLKRWADRIAKERPGGAESRYSEDADV